MRKLTSILFLALIAFVGTGCDSNDDPSDADLFVGTWALTGVSDASGDRLADFGAGFSSITLTNTADGNFTINVTPRQGQPMAITGTYVVVENGETITLRASVGGQTIPLNFTYDFTSDTVVALTSDTTTAVLLNNLFGTTLQGQVTMTVTKAG